MKSNFSQFSRTIASEYLDQYQYWANVLSRTNDSLVFQQSMDECDKADILVEFWLSVAESLERHAS